MVLVAGSTGVLGMEICRRLRARREPVRALVRVSSSSERVAALRQLGCDIAVGDLKDRASLARACHGADAVISTVSAIATAKPDDSFATTDAAGTMKLIDAARDAGARLFVFVSFDTTGVPEAPLVQAKADVENYLKQSGLNYTILHPSLFMESWLGPMLFADPATASARVYGDGHSRFHYVAVADVAEVAAQCVNNPAARNATIPIGGPNAVSQREAVQLFEQAFAKSFAVTEVPEAALVQQHQSAPDPINKSFAALLLGMARGAVAGAPVDQKCFSVQCTSVQQYAEKLAAQSTAAPPG
jgi:uncharacterized protein YbjT (DUF2867 family)